MHKKLTHMLTVCSFLLLLLAACGSAVQSKQPKMSQKLKLALLMALSWIIGPMRARQSMSKLVKFGLLLCANWASTSMLHPLILYSAHSPLVNILILPPIPTQISLICCLMAMASQQRIPRARLPASSKPIRYWLMTRLQFSLSTCHRFGSSAMILTASTIALHTVLLFRFTTSKDRIDTPYAISS